MVGAFCGKQKPEDINIYLEPFVKEFLFYQKNGLEINNKKYFLNLRCIIADAPARAFLLDIKCCTGYNSCHKCKVQGKYILHRITFPGIHHEIKTSEEFRNKNACGYHNHNEKSSIIEQIFQLDLVKHIPVDPMHALLLGVVKQLLKLWTKIRRKPFSMKKRKISKLSAAIQCISNQMPKEFQRKVDDLQYCKKYKATCFRQLLYILPVALSVVGKEWRTTYLNHFLKLCCAFRILASPDLCISQNDVASKLLESFVYNFKDKYGAHNVSFNVHSLLHLSEDVMFLRQPLDNYSAFKFENYLQILKKKAKCANKILEQLNNRYAEEQRINEIFNTISSNEFISKKNKDGSYESVIFNDYSLKSSEPDNFVFLGHSETIIRIIKIVNVNASAVTVIGTQITNNMSSIFHAPIDSKKLGMFKAGNNLLYSEEKQFEIHNRKFKKMIKFQFEDSVYLISMLH